MIRVRPRSDQQSGKIETTVTLDCVTDVGERLPPLQFEVEGLIRSRVAPIPDHVNFGHRSIGEAVEAEVRLEGFHKEPYVVEQIDVEDQNRPPLTVLAECGSGRLLLRTRLTQPGKYFAKVRIQVRLDNGDQFEAIVPVHAYVTKNHVKGGST